MDDLHPIRRFYRRYLARYAWGRWLKQKALKRIFFMSHVRDVITWRLRYTSQVMFFWLSQHINSLGAVRWARWMQGEHGQGLSFYSLTTLSEYCTTNHPAIYELASTEAFPLEMPTVYPAQYRQNLYSKMWPLDVPSVHAIEIPNAEIMGKCDFIFADFQCLHHGLYQFGRDLPAEEKHGMVSIDAKKGLLARYRGAHEQMETLPAAISLIGSASANYVHWLTETAPKLALIDEIEDYADLPLVIDAELHPNILESIHCLNQRRRDLIPIRRGQVCQVDKLVMVSPVAYVPFDYRPGIKLDELEMDPSWAMFVPRGLSLLRQKLVSRFTVEGTASAKRLFLRRTSKFRQMQNAVEVEALLHEYGFQIVEPETLSFADQVRLFSRAEMIVGQAGAALGNMIFAPKDCHVVILSAWSPLSIYYYFSNMATMQGQRCSFVLCDTTGIDDSHPAHKGFNVDIHTLKKAIGI
jgi:capsular polysaccharide biosynthesis protein